MPGTPLLPPDIQLALRCETKRSAVRQVGAIHAGLECGIIGQKLPGLDMVSYGPTIKGAHSPQERVLIATVEPFWQATLMILKRLALRQA